MKYVNVVHIYLRIYNSKSYWRDSGGHDQEGMESGC